jgi:hypothetical protein
LTVILHLKFRR